MKQVVFSSYIAVLWWYAHQNTQVPAYGDACQSRGSSAFWAFVQTFHLEMLTLCLSFCLTVSSVRFWCTVPGNLKTQARWGSANQWHMFLDLMCRVRRTT